jgi:nucleotide-binding universal stress UspA family protein
MAFGRKGSSVVIERTVIGWDGSEPARAALDWATAHASAVPLHLLRVVDSTISSAEYFVADSAAARARIALMDDAERVRTSTSGLHVTSELMQGDPIDVLRRYSDPQTLVVVGTGPRKGSTIRFEWSVGVQLAAKARGPIAVVPQNSPSVGGAIVVGVDGTAASRAAIDFAIEHARREGGDIRLVHAWSLPPHWEEESDAEDEPYVRSLEDRHLAILEEELSYLSESAPDLNVQPKLVRGPAYSALLETASRAKLLVVGRRGESALPQVILGSVSHAVLLNIVAPTVVVSDYRE